jgi:predicted esterase YcpF (UPF0227 family)
VAEMWSGIVLLVVCKHLDSKFEVLLVSNRFGGIKLCNSFKPCEIHLIKCVMKMVLQYMPDIKMVSSSLGSYYESAVVLLAFVHSVYVS